MLQTLKRHLMAGQRWLNRFQKARPDDLEEMMTLARDAEEIQVPFLTSLLQIRNGLWICVRHGMDLWALA